MSLYVHFVCPINAFISARHFLVMIRIIGVSETIGYPCQLQVFLRELVFPWATRSKGLDANTQHCRRLFLKAYYCFKTIIFHQKRCVLSHSIGCSILNEPLSKLKTLEYSICVGFSSHTSVTHAKCGAKPGDSRVRDLDLSETNSTGRRLRVLAPLAAKLPVSTDLVSQLVLSVRLTMFIPQSARYFGSK